MIMVLTALATMGGNARADGQWRLRLEGGYATPLRRGGPDLFGPGAGASVSVGLNPALRLGVALRTSAIVLSDGEAPQTPGRIDPGVGSAGLLTLALRLSPPNPERGPWLEVGAGGALTGRQVELAVEAATGWRFPVGTMGVGPALRYVQVVDRQDVLDARDARLVMVGLEVSYVGAGEPAPEPTAPAPTDRDRDGILDREDLCPDDPEDEDGFEDDDGCPDLDDDADGLEDTVDACRLEPEDRDGFADEDGCPDPDNDGDGFLDTNDACPDRPETLNGVDDHDGCPDEGLIQMLDDRIVLDERLLFDTDLAKLRPGARPILKAVVTLYQQHPEWRRIRIEGHTDERGTDEYNRRLSERRARVAMTKLIELGIPTQVIDHVGYGRSRPRNPSRTREAYRENRRVEFVVLTRDEEVTQ